jgi:sugar lactone lactonase YvrE
MMGTTRGLGDRAQGDERAGSGRWFRCRAVAAAGILLAWGAAACGGEPGPETSVAVDTLPNGAVRVHTPADGIWRKGEGWRLEEEFRLGTATGEGPEVFADVRGMALDGLGRVWVLDTEAVELRAFDARGEFVRSVGREGEGPGELRYPNGVGVGGDGRIHVFDPRGNRIVVFDTAGRHVADHRRTTGGWGYTWRGGITRDGRLFDYRVQFGTVLLGPDLVERDTVDLAPALSEREATYYVFTGPNRRGGRSVMTVPFLGRPSWEPGPAGRLWTTPTRPYRFVALSTELDTVRIVEREHTPIPVSAADRDSVESLVRERFAPSADLDLSRIPETKQAVEDFFFDDEGNLWARPVLRGDSTGHALDVFDPEGRYLGRVRSPVKLRRWPDPVVRDGRLVGVTVDELDVPYVVVFRIQKPGGTETRDSS